MRRGKTYKAKASLVKSEATYPLREAVALVKSTARAKFDETVEMHLRLEVDPKQPDQNVRGTVLLPHGIGKTKRVVVVAKGEKVREAEAAGADLAGGEELIDKIAKGWMEFDVLVSTPDMMKDLSKLGKTLGPRGLMPNPKSGTVTFDLAKAVKEIKAGKIEYKVDPTGIIHAPIGRASFAADQLEANARALWSAVLHARPASAKGQFFRSVALATSMGPGVRLDPNQRLE